MKQKLATLAAAAAVAALLAAGATGSTASTPNWAKNEIATVVAHGLMDATSVSTFKPNAALTVQALTDLGNGIGQALGPVTAASRAPADTTSTGTTTTTGTDETAPVTMAALNRQLVIALGLRHEAAAFRQAAIAAGLKVPHRFGTEVVARLLSLRINHPAPQDSLELRPQDTATRAEAAYSAAQILAFGRLVNSWQIAQIKELAATISLPALTDWQKQILNVAVSKIGMPYVWGGTSDTTEAPFGVEAPGGYDCSGFVWRVYKLQQYPNEGKLASTLQGRTTYTMSVEVPRAQRVSFAQLEPADLIFFGANGPRSSGAEIIHMGLYVGGGWFIHSSRQGVYLSQLTGWYRTQFAWGRRPLREAGLDQPSPTTTEGAGGSAQAG